MSQVRTIHQEVCTLKEYIMGTFMVFMYIFSFYVLGSITSSIVVAIIAFPLCIKRVKDREVTFRILKSKYFEITMGFLVVLMSLCILYSTIHLTHDMSYLKTLVGQIIQLISGVFVISFLIIKCNVDTRKVLYWIILSYIIQSIIELIAVSIPSVADSLIYFNHADEAQEKSGGVRGMALASGTTWSLGLTYGIAFIIYFGVVLAEKINLKTSVGLIILISGTIFAGRTGFVGAVIGGVYFLLFGKRNIFQKTKLIGNIIAIISGTAIMVFIIAPEFVEYMIFNVMPWAFEPIINYLDNGSFSSMSTDALDEMWNEIPTIEEALLGTGHFSNADGSYYRHTDVGVLRNLFYWGIGGYLVLVSYQVYLMWPVFKLRTYRTMWFFVLIYLIFCEYKAMTLGYNKQTISLVFLVSFVSYYRSKYKDVI